MTAVQDLRDDPLAFLRHNYIVLGSELHKPAPKDIFSDGTVRIKLEDTTSDFFANQITRPRNRRGLGRLAARFGGTAQSVKVTRQFKIKLASYTDTDVVPAYICPYVMGETHSATVGNDASLMFTAEMTGCTFGVGSMTGGVQMVCHANDAAAGLAGGALGQQTAQQGQAAAALLEPGTLFEPDQYRPATTVLDMRSAILGFREAGVWQYWAQIFQFTGTGLADMQLVRIA